MNQAAQQTPPAPLAPAPPAPTVTSTPASRQARLRTIAILQARSKGIQKMIDHERNLLEMEMRQAGAGKTVVDEGDAFFRSKRKIEVTNPQRLAEVVPAVVLAENFKPTVAFVEGLQKAGLDWKSCIKVEEGDEFRIEGAKTAAAKEYQKRIIDETAQQSAQVAAQIAARLGSLVAANPPAKP